MFTCNCSKCNAPADNEHADYYEIESCYGPNGSCNIDEKGTYTGALALAKELCQSTQDNVAVFAISDKGNRKCIAELYFEGGEVCAEHITEEDDISFE